MQIYYAFFAKIGVHYVPAALFSSRNRDTLDSRIRWPANPLTRDTAMPAFGRRVRQPHCIYCLIVHARDSIDSRTIVERDSFESEMGEEYLYPKLFKTQPQTYAGDPKMG